MTQNEVHADYLYITQKIGNIVRQYRTKANISLRDIYRDTSISIKVISDLENGIKSPSFHIITKLMNYLNIPYEMVFNSNKLPSKLDVESAISVTFEEALIAHGLTDEQVKIVVSFADYLKGKRNKNNEQK